VKTYEEGIIEGARLTDAKHQQWLQRALLRIRQEKLRLASEPASLTVGTREAELHRAEHVRLGTHLRTLQREIRAITKDVPEVKKALDLQLIRDAEYEKRYRNAGFDYFEKMPNGPQNTDRKA
jgi:hypothetical protein